MFVDLVAQLSNEQMVGDYERTIQIDLATTATQTDPYVRLAGLARQAPGPGK